MLRFLITLAVTATLTATSLAGPPNVVMIIGDDQGWTDYLHWSRHDPKIHARLNELIEDARRSPFKGIGKPEPLKGDLAGFWSRRVTGEHRLVYTVEGKTGADQRIVIVLCRYHY